MNKLQLSILVLCVCFAFKTQAQEHKVSMSQGKLVINGVNEIVVEGHSGSDVIFTRIDYDEDVDEKAKGLFALSAKGLRDNTGIGLSVLKEGSELVVNQIGKNNENHYQIQVPRGVSILYEHSSHNGEDILFKDVQSEIEVSVNYNSVILKDVTGPMAINTVYGSIEADFSQVAQDNAISLHSVYGDVDVSLPSNTPANLMMNTSYGEMFTDFDINVPANQDGNHKGWSSSKFSGSINGGGVSISLKANYDNIYLRKKN